MSTFLVVSEAINVLVLAFFSSCYWTRLSAGRLEPGVPLFMLVVDDFYPKCK